jgi:hypothetical protein
VFLLRFRRLDYPALVSREYLGIPGVELASR